MTQCQKTEKTILWISFASGICFAIVEVIMAVYSHSQSVLMDAAYDSIEIAIIGLTLFLTPLFHRPISEKRPVGYSQVESVFVLLKSFMMLAVSLGLSANSIQLAISGGNRVNAGQISAFQVVLGLVSTMVLLVMLRLNKKISSPIIQTEIYGWKVDVFYSLGMSAAFFVSTMLDETPLAPILPYFDQLVAIAIVVVMLPEVITLLVSTFRSLFLFAPEEEIVDRIKLLTHQVLQNYPYHTVFFDIERTGRRMWITVYFMIDNDLLSLNQLWDANDELQKIISREYEDCTVELVPTNNKILPLA